MLRICTGRNWRTHFLASIQRSDLESGKRWTSIDRRRHVWFRSSNLRYSTVILKDRTRWWNARTNSSCCSIAKKYLEYVFICMYLPLLLQNGLSPIHCIPHDSNPILMPTLRTWSLAMIWETFRPNVWQSFGMASCFSCQKTRLISRTKWHSW